MASTGQTEDDRFISARESIVGRPKVMKVSDILSTNTGKKQLLNKSFSTRRAPSQKKQTTMLDLLIARNNNSLKNKFLTRENQFVPGRVKKLLDTR